MEIKYEQTGSPWVLLTEEQAEAWKRGESITIQPPKPKQWEPKGGYYLITIARGATPSASDERMRMAGIERRNLADAAAAAAQLRQYARLLAYRDEFAPGYVVPPVGQMAWSVFWRDRRFLAVVQSESRDLLGVYMPQDVAEELARKLNSGEVVL